MNANEPAISTAEALAATARLAMLPSLLKVICETTGMGFAAVARVTQADWVACAVLDTVDLGVKSGDGLAIETTLCSEVRLAQSPIAMSKASDHPIYCAHPTPKLYGFESYVSVPIVLSDGVYFGSLCALDPRPADVDNGRVLALFEHFAKLIALELENQLRIDRAERELIEEKAGGVRREEFMAVLAHDLRNPLAAILACAGLLKRLSGSPERVVGLSERIARNVLRISGLTDNLLDLTRGRLGGGLHVESAPIDDLEAVLEDAIDELRVVHAERTVLSTIAVPDRVVGDRGRLQQLVSNLVGNALTHGSPYAPVRVDAVTEAGALRIAVHNTGEPIAPERAAGLFEPFRRAVPHPVLQGGLGLGLSICKMIVEAHGGSLGYTSTALDGTTFTAVIPLR